MSADQRVELAREYLNGARERPVDHLPPSRLMAEVAETRRQLGAVLAAYAGLAGAPVPLADRPMDTDDLDPETGEQGELMPDGEH